jgi:hypothetical protein
MLQRLWERLSPAAAAARKRRERRERECEIADELGALRVFILTP